MNVFLFWLTIFVLFFMILPAAAISLITIVRFFYRKIRKRKTVPVSQLTAAVIIAVVCLAVIPPITFAASESTMKDVIVTDDIAFMTIDTDMSETRYIEYNGREYQELDTSISVNEYFDYSEDAGLKYDGPIANVVFRDQSLIAKYVYYVFRYPVDSQLIYSVKNDGMNDCISLDETTLFCDKATIDKRLAYYRDTKNYNYYAIDYNSDKSFDIAIDNDSIEEINELANRDADDTVDIKVDADYDMYTILGESKDKLILREIGEIYVDRDGKIYTLIDEIWNDDGTVTLQVFPLSDNTAQKITTALSDAGVI